MSTHVLKDFRLALSVGAITLLIAGGISGCGVTVDPALTPPPQASASGETTTVTPLQPGSREWNDANWGDTGL